MLNEHILHDIERLVSEDSMRELMFNMVNAQGRTTAIIFFGISNY